MKKIPPKLTLSSRISTRHLRQYVNVVGHHHSDVYELWFWFSHLQHSTHEAVRPYGISHTVLSIHFRWRVENIFCAVTTIEKLFKVMRSICIFAFFMIANCDAWSLSPKIPGRSSLSHRFYLNFIWFYFTVKRRVPDVCHLQSNAIAKCSACYGSMQSAFVVRISSWASLISLDDFFTFASVARNEGTVSNLIRMRRYAIHLFFIYCTRVLWYVNDSIMHRTWDGSP